MTEGGGYGKYSIQPSHPLSPCSPLAFDLSQHQGLFQLSWLLTSGSQKYYSFSFSISPSNWIFGVDFLSDWMVWLLPISSKISTLLYLFPYIISFLLLQINCPYSYLVEISLLKSSRPHPLKNITPGFPQWFSGQDSMLPPKGIQVEFPKGRFAYHASSACHAGGQNKKSKKSITPVIIPVLSNNFLWFLPPHGLFLCPS